MVEDMFLKMNWNPKISKEKKNHMMIGIVTLIKNWVTRTATYLCTCRFAGQYKVEQYNLMKFKLQWSLLINEELYYISQILMPGLSILLGSIVCSQTPPSKRASILGSILGVPKAGLPKPCSPSTKAGEWASRVFFHLSFTSPLPNLLQIPKTS